MCKFCEDEDTVFTIDDYEVYLCKDKTIAIYKDYDLTRFDVNFCPFCGRKLEVEE